MAFAGNRLLQQARAPLTQEQIVEELRACGEEMFREGRLDHAYDLTLRQYRRWESANPPWPRGDSRAVLTEYFGKNLNELGFTPPAASSASPPSDARDRAHALDTPRRYGPDVLPAPPAVAPLEAGDPTKRRSLLAAISGGAIASVTSPDGASAAAIHQYTRHTAASDLDGQDIEGLELAVHSLAATYSARTPQELWPVAAAHRHQAAQLLNGTRHTLRQGREIAHHAGMLSVILAWIAHDLGRRDLVAALHDDAWYHGEESGSPEVCAWAENVACTDALYDDRPLDALAAATRGLAVAPRDGNAAIWLSAQLSRVHARLGNREAFAEAAARTRRYRDRIPQHGGGLFSVDAARLPSYDASSYGWLGQHELSREAAIEAISYYRTSPDAQQAPTRKAVAELDLALAHAALGEPTGAITTARQALHNGRTVQSVLGRVHHLRRSLLTRYPALPEVTAFNEEVRSITA